MPGRTVLGLKSLNFTVNNAPITGTTPLYMIDRVPELSNLIDRLSVVGVLDVHVIGGPADGFTAYVLDHTKSTYSVQTIIDLILHDAEVEYAEPDYLLTTNQSQCEIDFDLEGNQLWALDKINIQEAWAISKGSPSTVVAVIDTGADYTHPDLGNIVNGWSMDFPGFADGRPGDCGAYHGTHVAGIIGGSDTSAIGPYGVAPGVSLLSIALDRCEQVPPLVPYEIPGPSNSSSDPSAILDFLADKFGSTVMAQLFLKAKNEGADVINFSYGTSNSLTGLPTLLELSIRSFTNAGGVVVVSSGNDFGAPVSHPASYSRSIAVSATNREDKVSCFSSVGPEVTVSAPGEAVLSATSTMVKYDPYYSDRLRGDNNEFQYLSGTSMAAPHVTGLAALIKSVRPDWNYEQVKCAIIQGADDIESPGRDDKSGYGRINAGRSLALTLNDIGTDCVPTVELEKPLNNSGYNLGDVVEVIGTVSAKDLLRYTISLNCNLKFDNWTEVYASETLPPTSTLGSVTLSQPGGCKIKLEGVYSTGERRSDTSYILVKDPTAKDPLPPPPPPVGQNSVQYNVVGDTNGNYSGPVSICSIDGNNKLNIHSVIAYIDISVTRYGGSGSYIFPAPAINAPEGTVQVFPGITRQYIPFISGEENAVCRVDVTQVNNNVSGAFNCVGLAYLPFLQAPDLNRRVNVTGQFSCNLGQ